MTIEEAKEELVRRYQYLYENAQFILAPFMYEQNEEEFKKTLEDDFARKYIKNPLIYLKINRLDNINSLFEEFLLSDKPMEKSLLYRFVENKKKDKEYLNKVNAGLKLLEKKNKDEHNEILKTRLSIWNILDSCAEYIEEQSENLINKERKLQVIDEYYRILRYKNDGKTYISGRNLDLYDVNSISVNIPTNKRKPCRDKKDIGIKDNSFISVISSSPCYENNLSIFSEGEKQQIYLQYHDELPCDLLKTCELEEEYIDFKIETRLKRSENTKPCGKDFTVKEEKIFVNPNGKLYRYYQICPHCGYMVNIPNEILSNGIKQRIENRCSKDNKLFRKICLYSELYSLDKQSNEEQRRLLIK